MNFLITGAWRQAKDYKTAIEQMGHKVAFMQQEKDALPCDYEWVEGVICNGLFLTHPIEQFKNLRFIQLTSAGFDRVPMDYVKEHEIEIHNARGVYSIPMAEFAVAGVLQLYKQSRFFYNNQKQHEWEKHRGLFELSGKTVCVIGCGDVGTECAKRFKAFDCHVIGVNRAVRPNAYFDKITALSDLDHILPISDVVILTLALTNETHHLMNAERMSRLKPTAIIVNIARGAVVETDALIQVLPKISGAVLDVFEEEPLGENSPLWDMENVVITPHNSFEGDKIQERMWSLIKSSFTKTSLYTDA